MTKTSEYNQIYIDDNTGHTNETDGSMRNTIRRNLDADILSYARLPLQTARILHPSFSLIREVKRN